MGQLHSYYFFTIFVFKIKYYLFSADVQIHQVFPSVGLNRSYMFCCVLAGKGLKTLLMRVDLECVNLGIVGWMKRQIRAGIIIK